MYKTHTIAKIKKQTNKQTKNPTEEEEERREIEESLACQLHQTSPSLISLNGFFGLKAQCFLPARGVCSFILWSWYTWPLGTLWLTDERSQSVPAYKNTPSWTVNECTWPCCFPKQQWSALGLCRSNCQLELTWCCLFRMSKRAELFSPSERSIATLKETRFDRGFSSADCRSAYLGEVEKVIHAFIAINCYLFVNWVNFYTRDPVILRTNVFCTPVFLNNIAFLLQIGFIFLLVCVCACVRACVHLCMRACACVC